MKRKNQNQNYIHRFKEKIMLEWNFHKIKEKSEISYNFCQIATMQAEKKYIFIQYFVNLKY